MRSVSVRLADLDRVKINLGIAGENEHTHVLFDCKKAFDQYPNATPFLIVTPPRGDIYPAVVTRDGDIVEWVVTDSDLIYHGNGKVQLQFKQGDIIMKSYEAMTSIAKSSEPTGTVPTPIQNWITQANAILASIPDDINAALAAAKASGEFDGADGVGIASITLKSTVGLVDTYTITLTDGSDYDFTVTNGKDGDDGDDGVGIQGIAKTGTVGLVDTYTITLTNGQTYTFTVTNGQGSSIVTPAVDKVFSSSKVDQELTDVKTAIHGVENISKTINKTDYSSLFELGSLYTYNGQETSSTTRMRTEYIPDGVTAIIPDAGYKYMLFSYSKNDEAYIGTWTGSGWNRNGTWLTNGINIPNSISDEYYYRILGATVNNDELNLGTDAKHINIIWETDLLLNKHGKSADSKTAGDLIRTITDNNKKNVTDYVFDVAIKDKYQFSAADFESGSFDTSFMNKIENTKRLRTKYLIPVKSGMSFVYNNPLLDLKIFVFVSKDGSIAQETEWISSGGNGTITISSNGYLLILLNSQNNITISDYSGTYALEIEKTDYSNPLFFYKTPNQEPIPNGSSALSYNEFMTSTWEAFRTSFSDNVTRDVLTNDTSNTFPIYEYVVTPSEHYTHTVLVAAGMHGDEYEGFWSLYRIINFLYTMGYKYEKTRDMLRNTKFIILPVLNPYGVEHRTRENSAGANAQDNYDVRWSDSSYRRTGSTPFQYNESKAVKLALEAHSDIEMFIEFHTDPYNPEKGNYTEVIETSALVPMAYNITLDERQNLKNDYGYTLPLSRDFVIWPTQQCNSIRYVEEVWNIPAILMETGIGGAAIGGTATLAEMAFNWYINCMIQAIKTLN